MFSVVLSSDCIILPPSASTKKAARPKPGAQLCAILYTPHGADFARHNITAEEIPQYIMTAVKYGTIIGYQGRGQGRPIYEFKYEGIIRRIAITIGSNGYVVGANPKSVPKEVKP